jgi:hypothetical protein
MKKQKTYDQIVKENAVLRENNARFLLAALANDRIIHFLEKKLHTEKRIGR